MNSPTQKHILVVDDNKEIRNVIVKILQKEQYSISTAPNGTEALEKANAEKPDLIVLDLMLPDIDGLEVCRTIRSEKVLPNVMIVMLTAKGTPEHKIEGYKAGADDYIEKPFHRDEFIARIEASMRLKILQDQLEKRNKQLIISQNALVQREKMATVGMLAAGLAHEFNNIMGGISGYAQMAKNKPEYLSRFLDAVITQAGRAKDIIDSLRTFIHPQEIHYFPVELKDILNSVETLVHKELQNKQIDFEVTIPENLPNLRGMPGQLQQIFLNLLLNAIHATDEGGKITIEASEQAPMAVITVTDTGCGIEKEKLNKIFDPFYTTKGSLAGGNVEGIGLGLSVVYNLVRIHEASISVKSTKGGGTTFTLEIPLYHNNPTTRSAEEYNTVMISDDLTQKNQLEQVINPAAITLVQDIKEAQKKISYKAYSTAFVDADFVRGEELIDLLTTIRCQNPEMFLVVISATLDGEESFQLSDKQLLKPCSPEVLHGLLLGNRQKAVLNNA